jgi:hypothetical protein
MTILGFNGIAKARFDVERAPPNYNRRQGASRVSLSPVI